VGLEVRYPHTTRRTRRQRADLHVHGQMQVLRAPHKPQHGLSPHSSRHSTCRHRNSTPQPSNNVETTAGPPRTLNFLRTADASAGSVTTCRGTPVRHVSSLNRRTTRGEDRTTRRTKSTE
jgi:hypothetical protein